MVCLGSSGFQDSHPAGDLLPGRSGQTGWQQAAHFEPNHSAGGHQQQRGEDGGGDSLSSASNRKRTYGTNYICIPFRLDSFRALVLCMITNGPECAHWFYKSNVAMKIVFQREGALRAKSQSPVSLQRVQSLDRRP